MIDTNITKAAMVSQGYFESGSGPEEILITGSCRTIAFTNYLIRWNETIGNNRFTIRRMDACEWVEVGIQERLERAKTDEKTLSIIRNCDIFIHEHIAKFGIFNTDSTADENIYDSGLNPSAMDIGIPNWHDHMILKNDWSAYGSEAPPDWIQQGELQVLKFIDVCSWSSFPEFGEEFKNNWRRERYFYRPNHTSAVFTRNLFSMMNNKFLHLETSADFVNEISQYDLFKEPNTSVTQEDVDGYRLEWR